MTTTTAIDYLTLDSYKPAKGKKDQPWPVNKLTAKETRPINFYSPILIRYTRNPARIVAIGPAEDGAA